MLDFKSLLDNPENMKMGNFTLSICKRVQLLSFFFQTYAFFVSYSALVPKNHNLESVGLIKDLAWHRQKDKNIYSDSPKLQLMYNFNFKSKAKG